MAFAYFGEPNAGNERWAFAFSAKEKWLAKARSDVDKIAKTKRGYKRIFLSRADTRKRRPAPPLKTS